MIHAIWYHLACNFTKSNTLAWVFFKFLKLYKLIQISQRITYGQLKPVKNKMTVTMQGNSFSAWWRRNTPLVDASVMRQKLEMLLLVLNKHPQ